MSAKPSDHSAIAATPVKLAVRHVTVEGSNCLRRRSEISARIVDGHIVEARFPLPRCTTALLRVVLQKKYPGRTRRSRRADSGLFRALGGSGPVGDIPRRAGAIEGLKASDREKLERFSGQSNIRFLAAR